MEWVTVKDWKRFAFHPFRLDASRRSTFPIKGKEGVSVNAYINTIREIRESGSPGRARTADPVINSHLLYQLSYRGTLFSQARRGLYQSFDAPRKHSVPPNCRGFCKKNREPRRLPKRHWVDGGVSSREDM